MYVRWKRRLLGGRRAVRSQRDPQYAISAVLVECHRVHGQPRQKVLRHLGSIKERNIADAGHRRDFWRSVAQAFHALELSIEQRRPLEMALDTRVPFPNPASAPARQL
jgi:hypothetical protein